jgi:uncharacterized protein
VLALAAALAAPGVHAAAPAAAQSPPAPQRWVTDETGFLSPAVRDALDRRLEQYEVATGHQVIVWIGQLPAGQALEDWTVRAFAAWGIGRKGKDDGVAVFLFPEARRVRIEVGYGLEGQLTDLASARIIRERVTPLLQQGDRDAAVVAAVDGVLAALGGEPGAPPAGAVGDQDRGQARPLTAAQKVLVVIIALFVLGLLITHPRLAVYLLFSIFSGGGGGGGRGWGGGGGGGGGFSGGGGRSGGGGASGSW